MPIRDDSAGSYGTWNNDELSWLDLVKAKASDGGNALANLGRNLAQGFSPIGTSEQGNMALQVPPIVSGIAQSYGRLAGSPSQPGNAYDLTGVPELDTPIQQDMSNVLLSLYGGNAVAGLAKRPAGSVGAGVPVKAASRYGDEVFTGANHGEAYQQAVNKFGESAVDDMVLKSGHLDGFIDETGDFIDRITARERVGGAGGYHASDLLSDTGKPSILGSAMAGEGSGKGVGWLGRVQNALGLGSKQVLPHQMDMFGARPSPSNEMPVQVAAITEPFRPPYFMADESQVGPHQITSKYQGSHTPGEYHYGFKVDGEYETVGGVDPRHYPAILDSLKSSLNGFIAAEKPTRIQFEPEGRNLRKNVAWQALGKSLAKRHGGRFETDGAFDHSIFFPVDDQMFLLSDHLPSLLGSALATSGEDYDLPEWLRFK